MTGMERVEHLRVVVVVVVVDAGAEVGGVWRDNTCPGCACDIPSHLYSLSFAPNPHWTQSFSQAAGDPRLSAPDRT
ncbi:hypothetical protein [Streptomyces coffeae]|uniref:Secreted protein n=1 Tax=Streptomyces coffeae TaxID=621382 RepID=A0ABS1NCU6_9ACTN|nr:hypothetical protein [Streptomyces coffeae]MBL1097878.1 hypothetical protein [Streptomyces coffeae]